jgi:hypothetical protein
VDDLFEGVGDALGEVLPEAAPDGVGGLAEVGGGGVQGAGVVEDGDGPAAGPAGLGDVADLEDAAADGVAERFAVAAQGGGGLGHGDAGGVEPDGLAEPADHVGGEVHLVRDDAAGVVLAVGVGGVFGAEDGLPGADAGVRSADDQAPGAGRVGDGGGAASGESAAQLVRVGEQAGDGGVPGLAEEGVEGHGESASQKSKVRS